MEPLGAATPRQPFRRDHVLGRGRSTVIAVIAGNTSRYGYAETIRGIEESARARGYIVSITVVDSIGEEDVERAVSLVVGQDLAGIVVLKFDPPRVAALKQLPDHIPTVAISGVRNAGVPQAVLDESAAAAELTEFLLGLGHRTVHHVRVPPSRREDGRTTGWRKALKKAGAEVTAPLDASWDPGSGRIIGQQLAKDETVTAVFCGNDEIAMGVIKGLADQGIRTPEDVSVVGFDNHPLSELWSPSLTAHQDFFGLGQRGFELLMGQVSREPNASRFSSERPALLIRSSAAAPNEHRGRSDISA